MAELKPVSGAKKFFDGALRAVKGENTVQLMEQFTSEMTLVAEGLCEDQSKLRVEVENLARELERSMQRTENDQKTQEDALKEMQHELEKRLDTMDHRMAEIEEQLRIKNKPEKPTRQKLLTQLTILASIIGGSGVLISLINLFR